MALAAYRQLLRSIRIAFQDDITLLQASRMKARAEFDEKINLSIASPLYSTAITHALDVSRVLRENVVQGRRLKNDAEDQTARYKLRIHKYTERGDNDSVKLTCGQIKPKDES
ncbi:BgTH12-01908 [Blumeria graminis f. sp. triticale]|uniref:Mitochondrial zinc maintenance protein 1, mitochondrial n=2 Tax=Blumeria graminis TaxID=34373 RepID=A0A9W4CZZ2_BLUGR|nr:BgTH12-01908 [Blumeria graminis f. sp. triticale]